MSLITRNVFIDTEFFVKANLDFNSRTIKAFEELCDNGEFRHVTCTIVVKEVERKIKEHIKDALRGIRSFRRKAMVLRDYEDDNIRNLFIDIDEQDIEHKALEAFNEFLEKSEASILDMKNVDLNEVIEMHFNETSPFSAKKPNEFRDAFTLLALRASLNEGEKIYIVSDDPDHVSFCNENRNFISVDTLSTLLDIYNKHNDERSKFIAEFLESKRSSIIEELKEKLESAEAYNSSTWEDSEIVSFEVIEISNFEPQIIYLDDESCQIYFDTTVKFKVKTSGPNTSAGYYDKEEGVLYTFEYITKRNRQEKEFVVDIDLSFTRIGEDFINHDFDLNVRDLRAGIEFNIEESSYDF